MAKKTEENPTIIRDYLRARDFRNNRLWRFDPTTSSLTTKVNGKTMTADEFDRKYPVPKHIQFYLSNDNPDRTKSYLL